jgi:trigger factor
MNKRNKFLVVSIAFLLVFALLAGCSGNKTVLTSLDENFKYSYGITDKGFWDGVKALKNVTLGQYEGIVIPRDVHEITDDSIMAEVEKLLADYTIVDHTSDRAVEDGDTINLDYVGSIDGVEFAGGSTQDAGTVVTIGVTQYIDDFLEQLIGHMPGEIFDIEVTFPDEYHNEDLAGKDAVFEITLNYIVEDVIPEVTDEFVTENLQAEYGWATVTDMKTAIMNNLQASAIDFYLREQIVVGSTIESLPEIILEYQEFSMLQYYRDYATYYDMEFEEFLSASSGVSSAEELLEANMAQNTATSELFLILQAIAEDAGIKVSEDDAEEYFSGISNNNSFADFKNKYGLPHLMLYTLQNAVLEFIKDTSIKE